MPKYNQKQIRPNPGPGYVTTPPSAGRYIDSAASAQERTLANFAAFSAAAAKAGTQAARLGVEADEKTGAQIFHNAAVEEQKNLEKLYREQEKLYHTTGGKEGYIVTKPMMRGMRQAQARQFAIDDYSAVVIELEGLSEEDQRDPSKVQEKIAEVEEARRGLTIQEGANKDLKYFDDPDIANTYNEQWTNYKANLRSSFERQFANNLKSYGIKTELNTVASEIKTIADNFSLGRINPETKVAYTEEDTREAFKELFKEMGEDEYRNGLWTSNQGEFQEKLAELITDLSTKFDNIDPRMIRDAFENTRLESGSTIGEQPFIGAVLADTKDHFDSAVALYDSRQGMDTRVGIAVAINQIALGQDEEGTPLTENQIKTRVEEVEGEIERAAESGQLTDTQFEKILTDAKLTGSISLASLREDLNKIKVDVISRQRADSILFGSVQYAVNDDGTPQIDENGMRVPERDEQGNVEYANEGFVPYILRNLTTRDGMAGANLSNVIEEFVEKDQKTGGTLSKNGYGERDIMRLIESGITEQLTDIVANSVEMRTADGEMVPENIRMTNAVARIVPILANWNAAHPEGPIKQVRSLLNDTWNYVQQNRIDEHPRGDLSSLPKEEQDLLMGEYQEEYAEKLYMLKVYAHVSKELIKNNKSWDIAGKALVQTGSGVGEALESMAHNLEDGMTTEEAVFFELYEKAHALPSSSDVTGLAAYLNVEMDEIRSGETDIRQLVAAELMKATRSAVDDDLPDDANASSLFDSDEPHPEDGLPITKTRENEDYLDSFGVQHSLQSRAVALVSAKHTQYHRNSPTDSWSQAMEWGTKNIRVLQSALLTKQHMVFGVAEGEDILETRYEVETNDFAGDSDNNVNKLFSDFITENITYEDESGRTFSIGMGFKFDADDHIDVGSALIAEFGEQIDAEDYADAGHREEYFAMLRDIKKEDLYWVQSEDGTKMLLYSVTDDDVALIPPVDTADFARFYNRKYAAGEYKKHR